VGAQDKADPVRAYINFDMIGTTAATNHPHRYSILNGSTFDDVRTSPACRELLCGHPKIVACIRPRTVS
jgi:Zn-dependent M28 family amino/carboxypeptidase